MALSYDDEMAMRAQTMNVRLELERRKAIEEAEVVDLPVRTARAQLEDEYVPPVWRINGLHVIGSNTTITASYKTGKSTLMLNLLRSLLDGASFLDQPVTSPERNVAYWNLEVEDSLMLEWISETGIKNLDRLYPLHLRGVKLPLYHPEVEKRVVGWLQEADIECLIIDPGARLLPGWPGSYNPENDNGTIGEVVQKLDEIKRAAGVRDLFMPLHTGRGNTGDGQHSRGATKWDDWVDHLWQMWKKKIDGEGDVRHFKAYGRKVDFPEKLLSYDEANHRYGVEDTLETVKERGRAKSVVKAIAALGGSAGTAELRKATKGVSNEAFPDAVAAAVARGWVVVTKVGRAEIHRIVLENEDVRNMAYFEEREGLEKR